MDEFEELLKAERPPRRSPFRGIIRLAVATLIVVAILAIGGSVVLGVILYRHAHPTRVATEETPAGLFLSFEDVTFSASDGRTIAAWWIRGGKPGLPVIVLAHDLGETRASLLGLAARLVEQNYAVLLLDFRGHGASGGSSSFGVLEKRDLLGAIDWIGGQKDADGTRIGIVGIGMGAYAAILAAAERPQVRCLVLDSPYPDAPSEILAASMAQGTLRNWTQRWSTFVYDVVYRVRASSETATGQIGELSDRNLLILAPEGGKPSAEDARALYESVSEARHNFKNLRLLKATRTTTLYGADRDAYDHEVLGFFSSYLPPAPRGAQPAPAGTPSTRRH